MRRRRTLFVAFGIAAVLAIGMFIGAIVWPCLHGPGLGG